MEPVRGSGKERPLSFPDTKPWQRYALDHPIARADVDVSPYIHLVPPRLVAGLTVNY